MRRHETKKAALDEVALNLWREASNGILDGGLRLDLMAGRALRPVGRIAGSRVSFRPDGRGAAAPSGERRAPWANMLVPLRSKGCELGGSLHSLRRMTAAPALLRAVAFSFGGVRTHGLIAPALYRFRGLMPCGKPSGLPFPKTRSANPHGVALLLAEESGFRQSVLGACHE